MDTISWFVSDFLSVVVSAFVRELATVCPINHLSFPLVYSFFSRLSLLPSSIPSSPSIPFSLVYSFPRLFLPSSIPSSLVYPFFPRLSLLPSSIPSSLVYFFFPRLSLLPRLFLFPSSIPSLVYPFFPRLFSSLFPVRVFSTEIVKFSADNSHKLYPLLYIT
ncbi:hypothetical protein RIR_jg41762.t1 [Rhizophagus irregularis DAOM 181602=DAOM 197198]|uniref:Uncharacterized protein n=1 Tax=Rhizophagus irregularis (strain DAOM 197198w) TaxID=1432141 RepID=A0A015JEF0_RHIIW|nr:hypothetical protein RirG_133610 [Rhizophagus irregularis DAOM 197198w]GBC19499.1 hypothetical protein RIR_jg41762.t1 [Rhizophagus irregularis DAOM 181602=DAOM 197198]